MTVPSRRRLGLAAAALVLAAAPAFAQTPSDKPLRVIVAGPAGGTGDIVARLLAEGLGKELNQPVIVDDKPGAGGVIAMNDLLQSPREGSTVLVSINAVVSEVPHIIKLKFDPSRELRPLAELASTGIVMVGHPGLPAKNFAELIAYVKARPGKVSYASYSAGTQSHVLGLQLNKAAGIDMAHIGYKGSPPALADVMGGHVPLMFDGMPTSIPLIKSGKLKPYAVSLPARSAALPDVPTFAELGYPQLEARGWIGLWATPDMPAATQARLRDAALRIMANPSNRARLGEAGLEAGHPRTQDELAKSLQADFERIGAILKSINFKPE